MGCADQGRLLAPRGCPRRHRLRPFRRHRPGRPAAGLYWRLLPACVAGVRGGASRADRVAFPRGAGERHRRLHPPPVLGGGRRVGEHHDRRHDPLQLELGTPRDPVRGQQRDVAGRERRGVGDAARKGGREVLRLVRRPGRRLLRVGAAAAPRAEPAGAGLPAGRLARLAVGRLSARARAARCERRGAQPGRGLPDRHARRRAWRRRDLARGAGRARKPARRHDRRSGEGGRAADARGAAARRARH
mmetsp:Transcript_8855/g.26102  ORF Transcript_8855/g.26102 Transcript_8855/m.26102 type:complete len:246 (-) Transcript_8855:573-1310(-)